MAAVGWADQESGWLSIVGPDTSPSGESKLFIDSGFTAPSATGAKTLHLNKTDVDRYKEP